MKTDLRLKGEEMDHPKHGHIVYVPVDEKEDWGLMFQTDGTFVAGGRRDGRFYDFRPDTSLGYPVIACVQYGTVPEGSEPSYYGTVPVIYRSSDGALLVRETGMLGGTEKLYELVGTSSVAKGEVSPGSVINGLVVHDPKRLRGDQMNAGVRTKLDAVPDDAELAAGCRWMPIAEFISQPYLDGRATGALTAAQAADPKFRVLYAVALIRM